MAGGTWSPTEGKVRPGFYMRFLAAALAQIQAGPRGIVAIPVKANWGPVKEIVEITSEKELLNAYNDDVSGNFSAYTSIRLTLLGKPQKILGYRLVDGNESTASITLKDTAATPADVLTLTTKYPTERSFNVTVRDNLVDSNKKDIVLYEGTKKLYTFTFAKGAGIVDNAVDAINNNTDNKWLTATKVVSGNDTLADIANQDLTGGNAGAAAVANSEYIDAMATFEARKFNAFTLDGMTDSTLQTSVKSWVERLRNEGKGITAYLGGSETDDQDITTGNSRSTGFNFEGVINVGVSAVLDGVTYSSAMVACWAAGKASGQALKESLTYATTPFDDVKPRLTDSEIKSALQSGTLVLVHDGEKVVVEQGINTLTSLSADQNDAWKKIKSIRIMDAINSDMSDTAHDDYIGKIINNEDGQKAFLSAAKVYFETLSPTLISDDFAVQTDPELQPLAAGDEYYWRWDAKLIDSMEKIFGTGNVRYGG